MTVRQTLAFLVFSIVWICEIFCTVRVHHSASPLLPYFPYFFFSYFFLFLVYIFSFPFPFAYVALYVLVLMTLHIMLYLSNRAASHPQRPQTNLPIVFAAVAAIHSELLSPSDTPPTHIQSRVSTQEGIDTPEQPTDTQPTDTPPDGHVDTPPADTPPHVDTATTPPAANGEGRPDGDGDHGVVLYAL
mmetsp:Transcript_34022/g.73366  ORF Transcript_34022/g.73366 Transcript_34022/m.73366 type:complete len:188 (-) Transcript_34022:31-594(-)